MNRHFEIAKLIVLVILLQLALMPCNMVLTCLKVILESVAVRKYFPNIVFNLPRGRSHLLIFGRRYGMSPILSSKDLKSPRNFELGMGEFRVSSG